MGATTQNKRWYKVWWKILVGFVGAIGIVWGVFEGLYIFTDWWHNEKEKERRIEVLENTLKEVINNALEKEY